MGVTANRLTLTTAASLFLISRSVIFLSTRAAQSEMSAGWADGSQGQLADREKPQKTDNV